MLLNKATHVPPEEVAAGGGGVSAQATEHGGDVHADGDHQVVSEVGVGVVHGDGWRRGPGGSHQLTGHQPRQCEPLSGRHGAQDRHHLGCSKFKYF